MGYETELKLFIDGAWRQGEGDLEDLHEWARQTIEESQTDEWLDKQQVLAMLAAAKAQENVARYLEGATIRKEVLVPGRLVNFVVG